MSKHIYCITKTEQDAVSNTCPRMPLSGSGVYSIPHQDISMVVKDTPFATYGYISRDMLLTCLAEHQSIIEEIMKGTAIIPIKFGTIAKDEDEVMEILDIGYPRFKNAIEAMDGKKQIVVMALWNNLNKVIKGIGENDDIKRFKSEAAAAPPKEFTSNAVELGRLVKRALDEEAGKVRDEVVEGLKAYALNVRNHELMDDRMIMNTAFLVERRSIEKFYERVDIMDETHGREIDFKVAGPLPPYSFSTIEIKRAGLKEIEDAKTLMGISGRLDSALLPAEGELMTAHRMMLKEFHPDRNPDNPEAQTQFETMRKAYCMLMDCIQNNAHLSTRGDIIMVKVV